MAVAVPVHFAIVAVYAGTGALSIDRMSVRRFCKTVYGLDDTLLRFRVRF